MKPPECSICDELFFDGGGLVYFKETSDDKVQNDRLREKDMVGHPPNAFWFCKDHIEEAKKLSYFTKIEAFKKLNALFKKE